jgi:putative redox protein
VIKCYSKKAPFDTRFTNGRHEGHCDASAAKGGGGAGFAPPELMEAAIAGCINIWLRKYAADHDILLTGVMTQVALDQQNPGEAVFRFGVELKGALTEDQRRELFQAAHSCPLTQALTGKILFAGGPL